MASLEQKVEVGYKGLTAKIIGPCAGFIILTIALGVFLWYHNEQAGLQHTQSVAVSQNIAKVISSKLDMQTCIFSMNSEEKDRFRNSGNFKNTVIILCPWITGD